jgi:hypothetical protein
VVDRENLEIYLNTASIYTSETDIFPYGTKSLLTNVINGMDAALIPKYRGENLSSGFLPLKFLGRSELLCRQSSDRCFVSGY